MKMFESVSLPYDVEPVEVKLNKSHFLKDMQGKTLCGKHALFDKLIFTPYIESITCKKCQNKIVSILSKK